MILCVLILPPPPAPPPLELRGMVYRRGRGGRGEGQGHKRARIPRQTCCVLHSLHIALISRPLAHFPAVIARERRHPAALGAARSKQSPAAAVRASFGMEGAEGAGDPYEARCAG